MLIRAGNTHVLCTASIVAGVEPWREESVAGWVTAEYDILPGATGQRRPRSRTRRRPQAPPQTGSLVKTVIPAAQARLTTTPARSTPARIAGSERLSGTPKT